MKNVKPTTAAATMTAADHWPAVQSSKSARGAAARVAGVKIVSAACVIGLSMCHSPVLGRRDDLDGLGADHVDDDHFRSGGQRVLERHRLVLGAAVLHV